MKPTAKKKTATKGNRGGYRPGSGRKPGLASIIAERTRAYIAERLEIEIRPIVDKAIEGAKAGNKDDRQWLSDQAFGKPTQPTTVSDPNGDPLFKPSEQERAKAQDALSQIFGTKK